MPKGHVQNIVSDTNTDVDPFGNNVAASQAYKTVERLVTATYMVTNMVPEAEPTRCRIRDITNTLMEDTLRLRKGFNSLGSDTVKDIVAKVRLIMSMLDALHASGLISQMNLRVLKQAYSSFALRLESMSGAVSANGVELTKDYFSSPAERPAGAVARATKKEISKISKEVKAAKVEMANTDKVSDMRINNIIEFIAKRGKASVGDIAEVITGCSTKTLQRDLNNLVRQNILIKEGSKRWTRYAMALNP